MVKKRGQLQVVATPIGNRADLSPRAAEALAGADVIAAEDTRHTLGLLRSIGVSRPLVSLHEHNESERVTELLARLQKGETVALVSDAGTPLISDPGLELVRRVAQEGFEVHSIPGPSAIVSALTVAGLPTERFCFEGFLPARERQRRASLGRLAHEPRTLVFFEAPHRIVATLADLVSEFGAERRAAVARELTKAHETVYRGTLRELLSRAEAEENFRRGELTLVVEGAAPVATAVDEEQLRRTVALLAKELPPARAASVAAQLTGASRAAAYELLTRGAVTGSGGPLPRRDEEVP